MCEDLEQSPLEQGYDLQQDHVTAFKQEVLYWVNRFGLLDWEVNLQVQDPTEEHLGRDVMAWTVWSPESGAAMIVLVNRWLTIEPTDFEVRKAAFHEVCELMLNEVRDNLLPNVLQDKIIHRCIRRLEASVWLPEYQRRFET